MKSRRRILPKAAAVVVIISVALLWVVHYRGKSALEKYKQELVAAGEKLTIEELTPKPNADGQKASTEFSKAVSALTQVGVLNSNYPPSMKMVALGRAMIGWQQPDIRNSYGTNSWDDFRAVVESETAAFEMLSHLVSFGAIDDCLDYSQGFSMVMPGLVPRKQAMQHLSAATLLSLREGNIARAVTNLQTMLALVNGWRDERILISQLVCFSMASITLSANWELLQATNVTDAQLATLQDGWRRVDFERSSERSIEMERAMGILAAEQMKESGKAFATLSAPLFPVSSPTTSDDDSFGSQVLQFTRESFEKAKGKGKHIAWKTVWADEDQLMALKAMQALLESLRHARTNGYASAFQLRDRELQRLGLIAESDDQSNPLGDDGDIRHILSRGIITGNFRFPNRLVRMEAARRMMITAIALKRFQIAKGHLPESLSELSPDFVETVPLDPIDQKLLRYRPNQDGSFLLYSIGENKVDDGGSPKSVKAGSTSLNWEFGYDWVFPQPASAGEVAEYYKEIVKKRPY